MYKLNHPIDSFPKEAAIVGRLLIAYAELEFALLSCLANVAGNTNIAVRLMYRSRGERQRIEMADVLLRPKCEDRGCLDDYLKATEAMDHCRTIRNQYSHCNWDNNFGNLFFVELEKPAETKTRQAPLTPKHISLDLLEQQEVYFAFTDYYLHFVSQQIPEVKDRSGDFVLSRPQELEKPPRCTPAEKAPRYRHLGAIDSFSSTKP